MTEIFNNYFDILIKSLGVMGLAIVATACLRRLSASVRHFVWVTSLGAVLLLPAAQFLVPVRPDFMATVLTIPQFNQAAPGSFGAASTDVPQRSNSPSATYPQIDKNRIFVVGHSSAGTMALLAAENDPRIARCVAYAPVGELTNRHDQPFLDRVSRVIPNLQDLLTEASPSTKIKQLRCPVFIFHADDDENVPTYNVTNSAASSLWTRLTQCHTGHLAKLLYSKIPGTLLAKHQFSTELQKD